jgi:ankyrin repeat protein
MSRSVREKEIPQGMDWLAERSFIQWMLYDLAIGKRRLTKERNNTDISTTECVLMLQEVVASLESAREKEDSQKNNVSRVLNVSVYDGYYSPLYLAARRGNVDVVRNLIKYGASVDQKDSKSDEHVTALYVAAREGHAEVVEELVKHKADVNNVRLHKPPFYSPLMEAARLGHDTVVKALLATNVVDVDYHFGVNPPSTALSLAIAESHTNIATTLIEHKSHSPEKHKMALWWAAYNNNELLVRKLLDYKHEENINVCHYEKHPKKALIRRPDVHFKVSPVDCAMARGNLSLTYLLLSNGCVSKISVPRQNHFLAECKAGLENPYSNPEYVICLVLLWQQRYSRAENQDLHRLLGSMGLSLPTLPTRQLSPNECKTITANLRAQIQYRNHAWLTEDPCKLSAKENFAMGEFAAAAISASKSTLDVHCFRDQNLLKAKALSYLKAAALQDQEEAKEHLHDRLAAWTKDNVRSNVFSKDMTVQPVQHPVDDAKHGVPPSHVPAQSAGLAITSLTNRCDEVIANFEARASYLEDRGWDRVNEQMKKCVSYLIKRDGETRTGMASWFGYSKGDYNTRVNMMKKLTRLKIEVEEAPAEYRDVCLQRMATFLEKEAIPEVSRGWSKRFAVLLQDMRKIVADVEIRLVVDMPNQSWSVGF